MKKFALSLMITATLGLGAVPVSAQGIPAECGESENRPENCADFYPPSVLPPTTPPATTTTSIAVRPPGELPRTGSGGVSGILQVGTLLVVGGALVVVAVRRRSESAAPAN